MFAIGYVCVGVVNGVCGVLMISCVLVVLWILWFWFLFWGGYTALGFSCCRVCLPVYCCALVVWVFTGYSLEVGMFGLVVDLFVPAVMCLSWGVFFVAKIWRRMGGFVLLGFETCGVLIVIVGVSC